MHEIMSDSTLIRIHPTKYFSELSHYQIIHRYKLNTIAKALWNDRTPEERRQVYGEWVDLFTYEPNLSEADISILTYHWPYYIHHKRVLEAQTEIKSAHQHGKPMVVFSGGDHPANIPFEDVLLFESAGYRSTPGLRYHSGQPSYIPDYLDVYCGGELTLRPKRDIPVVGFCGQASTSAIQTVYRKLRLKWQQHQYRQGSLKWEPPPFETTTFRAQVLNQFENQPGIQTNFILRKRYQAGETENKSPHHPTKLEFVNNILNSDYTVCMRGGGNFSVRFYETLCLGRIPIFIDTDCLLPFQDDIDYKAIFPWIDIKDLPYAAEIVRDFHAELSNDDFIILQKACRDLWFEHMTPDGFHRDFVKKIRSLSSIDLA
jgi:hypothetical protein